MQRRNAYGLKFSLLIAGIIFLFLLDCLFGPVHIPLSDIWKIALGREYGAERIILLQSRVPRALTALLAGAGLAAAGLMMQTLFRNPLAGPDILGVSSGAGLFVALIVMGSGLPLLSGSALDAVNRVIAAVCGSMLTLFLVILIAYRVRDAISLLIFGLMLGTAIGALVSLIQFFSEQHALKNYIDWTFGTVSSTTWGELQLLIPVVTAGLLAAWSFSKSLNGLMLGEAYATSMGVHVRNMRFFIILVTGLLTGSITAFCGPLVFIGIATPHIARMFMRTGDHFVLMPAAILWGMLIMLACAFLSQLPGGETVLPLNAITALMGAPFVIYIVIRNHRLQKYF